MVLAMNIQFVLPDATNNKDLTILFATAEKEGKNLRIYASGDNVSLESSAKRLEFKADENSTILLNSGSEQQTLLVGLGESGKVTPLKLQEAGGSAFAAIASQPVQKVTLHSPEGLLVDCPEAACHIAFGFKVRAYTFNKYLTKRKDKTVPKFDGLQVVCPHKDSAEEQWPAYEALADALYAARDLQNEPANIIYPESMAQKAKELLEPYGVKVTILDEKQMAEKNMGALLGVGQGSAKPPRAVLFEYKGLNGSEKPIGLVGKGVTFDTGGISIKPSNGMEEMKWDMGGSAVVVGTILALAKRKAKVDVVGCIGLVENMPDGNAQRPGDIVTTASGQTVEVLNTDAEGRLVLADALWLIQETYDPRLIIDFATLTGAIVVALGDLTAGLFSNDDALAAKIEQAAIDTGEAVWRLPMNKEYDALIDADQADIKNISGVRGAGAITAAQFLSRFVDENRTWAHIDIAGTTWATKPKPLAGKGAMAFGVRLAEQLIRENFEE